MVREHARYRQKENAAAPPAPPAPQLCARPRAALRLRGAVFHPQSLQMPQQ